MRLCAVMLVAACGGPGDPAPPRVRVPPPSAPTPDIAPPAPDIAPPAPHIALDTSVATVWGYDPNRRESWSPFTPRPEYQRVATAMPQARVPGRRAPCFARRDVLVAAEAYQDLESYILHMGEDERSRRGRYGTCTIVDGTLRDARGTLVGELGCGFVAHVPGIIDDLGFEVGARGSDVAAAHANDGDAMCLADGTMRSRCWFGSEPYMEYYFAATFDTEDGTLRGRDARALFDSHVVVSLTVNAGNCH